MNNSKKTILVIFGGVSSEHEISCVSASNIIKCIDRELWSIIPVGITTDGRWLLAEDEASVRDGSWKDSGISAELSPDAGSKCLIATDGEGNVYDIPVDVCWPALHGKFGEDGTIQGLLEMAQIPYVGCGVLASAVSMDKFFTKLIVDSTGIRQAGFVGVYDYELDDMDRVIDSVEKRFSYPVFVKPSKAGSSCGVSKADSRDALIRGLKAAAEIDSKILVEEFIKGREIECAVKCLEPGKVSASGIGEIISAADFYDYDSKYNSPDSMTVTDPEFPAETVEEIRRDAVRIFKAVDGFGLARVDFFVDVNGSVVFNEINTMPGFTEISMYPMLWEAKGISKEALVEELIESAFARH